MTTVTVQAVYRSGVLQPTTRLDLPEEALVEVQVTPMKAAPVSVGSLFGAFPELKAIIDARRTGVPNRCMTAFSRSTYETLLGIKHNRKPAPGISFDVCFERRV